MQQTRATKADVGRKVTFRAWTSDGRFKDTRIIKKVDSKYVYVRCAGCAEFMVNHYEIEEVHD